MINYKSIGFKCGLEVHNRLNTKTKLFCNCKPGFSKEKPILVIKRKLRPVAGELGQVDIAAIYEYLRDRVFFYNCYDNENCLIDSDEEPPFPLNQEALEVALQVSKLLRAEIPDEIHVMRKTVIDGSNTCAFQRTAIVGLNGSLQTSKGKVRITNISLEEESAGILEQQKNEITYRLDRLGIPLIEVGTAADIKDPEHAKEVAEKLGMIIRSTGKSQRGIGVTRQDINVSIEGGARVEIKGVQELDLISTIIENEIKRQTENKGRLKEETRVAKADGTTEFIRPLPGGERLYPETDIPPIVISKELRKIKTPETWEQKEKRFKKVLPQQIIEQLLRNEYLDLFEKFHSKFDPVLVANTFTSTLKDLRRRGFNIDILQEEHFKGLFEKVKKKEIGKEAIPTILEFVSNENMSIEDAIKKSGLKTLDESNLKKVIKDTIEKYPHLVRENKISALMGEIMKTARGSVDGKTVFKLLKKELEISKQIKK